MTVAEETLKLSTLCEHLNKLEDDYIELFTQYEKTPNGPTREQLTKQLDHIRTLLDIQNKQYETRVNRIRALKELL